ncbi:MAG: acyl transferase, partial [Bacteroidota bacterium]|nr:acyl transferase [Bacteroidota bacterium]
YIKSFTEAFRTFYGNVEEYNIIALLPSYVERQGSSLVYMVEHLIKDSKNCESGFFLNSYYNELSDKLIDLRSRNKKTLLIGVTYALLDFAEFLKKSGRDKSLEDIIIMETGGMKGRRKEMIKEEMHSILKESFGVNSIHSEYGMTELLSQAYSYGESIYECPPWMSVLIRDINDPFTILEYGRSGIINIIDLANIYSCSFIATDDLGVLDSNGKFQIRGRLDNSQIRGCNLLI